MNRFLFLCIVFFLSSCTSNAALHLVQDEEAFFSFNTEASDGVSGIIRSFAGIGNGISIFDKDVIEGSFSSAGITLSSVSSSSTTDITIAGVSNDLNNIVPEGKQPVLVTDTTLGTEFLLVLDEQTMGALFSFFGEEALLYIELLQAPLFTGEEMTAKEYSDFIGALYGQTMLDELLHSTVTFEISVPQNIRSISLEPSSVGTVDVSQTTATIVLSLTNLLVNTSEIKLSMAW